MCFGDRRDAPGYDLVRCAGADGTVILDGETIAFTILTSEATDDGTTIGVSDTDEDGNEVRITMTGPAASEPGRQEVSVLLGGRQGVRSARARGLPSGRNRSGGRVGPVATYLAVYDRDAAGAWMAWGRSASGPVDQIYGSTVTAEGDFRDGTRHAVEMSVSIDCSR